MFNRLLHQIIDPFVEVEIIGLPVDCCKEQTRVVDDNGETDETELPCSHATPNHSWIYTDGDSSHLNNNPFLSPDSEDYYYLHRVDPMSSPLTGVVRSIQRSSVGNDRMLSEYMLQNMYSMYGCNKANTASSL